MNPAAEVFFNTTLRAMGGEPVYDRLAIDVDVEEALLRVRRNQSPLFINDAQVGTGERAPVQSTLQIAPMSDDPARILFLIAPREIAGRLGRSLSAESAAKSAIGMAEMLAHEIKNPLAGITGAAQLLSMNAGDEDRELCDLIVAETRRVVKLLEQVEQFGNLRRPACRPVNLHDLLDRARKSAQMGFGSHMTFREDYDPSLPPTWADGDQLVQVFLNLLKNAAQAADREGGTILIRTFYEASLRVRRAGAEPARVPLQVEIVDDGPGLPPEIAEDVFEPFVSGRENGTGLGLALVSKIIADHNAWISVDSVPGRTAFRISLPVAPETTHSDDHEEHR
jgi:two-component system nitrogen regulation sensor histidine kinase GlnL